MAHYWAGKDRSVRLDTPPPLKHIEGGSRRRPLADEVHGEVLGKIQSPPFGAC